MNLLHLKNQRKGSAAGYPHHNNYQNAAALGGFVSMVIGRRTLGGHDHNCGWGFSTVRCTNLSSLFIPHGSYYACAVILNNAISQCIYDLRCIVRGFVL